MALEGILKKLALHLPESSHSDLRRAWEIQGEITRSALALRRPRRGRRVVFRDFEVADLEGYIWRGPSAGELLVQVHYSAVSPGTEGSVLTGLPNAVRSFPFYPGYSGSGQVISVGRGVKNFRTGDLVAGRMNHGSLAIVSTENVIKFPPGQSPEHFSKSMSLIELACIVQQGLRKAQVRPGQHVAIVGAGLLGQLSTLYAHYLGAGQITLIARSQRSRLASTEMLPPHEFVAIEDEGPSATGQIDADVVIEAAGSAAALMTSVEVVRNGGRIVNLGSPRDTIDAASMLNGLAAKGATLIGAHISTLPEIESTNDALTLPDERVLFEKLVRDQVFQMPESKTVPAVNSQVVNNLYESIINSSNRAAVLIFSWL